MTITPTVATTMPTTPDIFTPKVPDPLWTGLSTTHAHLSSGNDVAKRYRADVTPFAAVYPLNSQNLKELSLYTKPGERMFIAPRPDEVMPKDIGPEWRVIGTDRIVQMILTGSTLTVDPASSTEIRKLTTETDFKAMLELTALVLPTYFRTNTHLMGDYFGIFRDGQLIAMGGERFVSLPYREVSGICTHPNHVRKGLAGDIIRHVCQRMHERGEKPFLHVSESNVGAYKLYEKLGFTTSHVFGAYLFERQYDFGEGDSTIHKLVN